MFWTKVWETFVQSLKTFKRSYIQKNSSSKYPYGHMRRSFDKPADFFFFRFRSFLAQNPRTIKRRGSFQREFYSSVRRFRRTRRKQFFTFPPDFPERFSLEKCVHWNAPQDHLVCIFHNLPQFLCPELQKTKLAQSHKTFENRKIHSTQKKNCWSKLPLNRWFAVLRTCWLSGPKVCHRSGQALKIQKTGNFNKKKTVSSG